jgi:thioredoxin-related protein
MSITIHKNKLIMNTYKYCLILFHRLFRCQSCDSLKRNGKMAEKCTENLIDVFLEIKLCRLVPIFMYL